MKKYLVIGNPIEHSLSPQLHNYWIKKNNINAIYEKLKLNTGDLKDLFIKFKEKKIDDKSILPSNYLAKKYGWTNIIKLSDGLKKTINIYRNH